eukprot:TRINITY_DN11649_c0_g1_i1.p1 TRINITY_DN11649_c0_g1~~TRINITY_DN11649_c0_g1_i1.p1  ORF type:complete len:237 (+),score=53.81 TRINITY_DN11649_c0_g1_i1:52-762(+)
MSDITIDQLGDEGIRSETTPDLTQGLIFFGNRTCPFAHRAWLAALEKGIKFDTYYHIELGPNKPAYYKEEVNPHGTVPAIYHNGKAVFESNVVAQYFDDLVEENPLVPRDAYAASQVRYYVDQLGGFVGIMYGFLKDASKQEAANEGFDKVEEIFSRHEGPFVLGDVFTMADISILPFIDRFSITLKEYRGYDIFENRPHLRAFYDASIQRESFQLTSQPEELYVQMYRGYANPDN